MDEIELVVKIPKGFIDKMNSIKDDRELSWAQLLTVYRGFHAMLQHGTPLPKGHGRIGDLDALRCENADFDTYNDYCIMFDEIEAAPTIIEVDKEEV